MVRPEEDSGYESGAKIFSKEEMSYVEAVDYGNRGSRRRYSQMAWTVKKPRVT